MLRRLIFITDFSDIQTYKAYYNTMLRMHIKSVNILF